jgi:hypothetical protein
MPTPEASVSRINCPLDMGYAVYLGHVVCRNGIKPNHKIIDSVENWKVPSSVKDVQKFLGLCNYYRSYVTRFSEVAAPLSSLTKKGVTFKWSDECNN